MEHDVVKRAVNGLADWGDRALDRGWPPIIVIGIMWVASMLIIVAVFWVLLELIPAGLDQITGRR